MSKLSFARNMAIVMAFGSFFLPQTVYGECEESIVCESRGSDGCYYEAGDDEAGCFAHSCQDGHCSSACWYEGEQNPGICGEN